MKVLICNIIIIAILIFTMKALGDQPDLLLNPGQSSVSGGVLISPGRYRLLSIDHEEAKNFNQALNNPSLCAPGLPQLPTVSLFSTGGYAFVVTLTVAAFIAGVVFEHNR